MTEPNAETHERKGISSRGIIPKIILEAQSKSKGVKTSLIEVSSRIRSKGLCVSLYTGLNTYIRASETTNLGTGVPGNGQEGTYTRSGSGYRWSGRSYSGPGVVLRWSWRGPEVVLVWSWEASWGGALERSCGGQLLGSWPPGEVLGRSNPGILASWRGGFGGPGGVDLEVLEGWIWRSWKGWKRSKKHK